MSSMNIKQQADALKRDEKIDKDDRKADASMRHCINCQLTHEESAEEIEKDNEQT